MLTIIPKPSEAHTRHAFEEDARWFAERPARWWRLRALKPDEGLAIADLREGCEGLAAWAVVVRPFHTEPHAYSRWFGVAQCADIPAGTEEDADDLRAYAWLSSQLPTCNMHTAWPADFFERPFSQ